MEVSDSTLQSQNESNRDWLQGSKCFAHYGVHSVSNLSLAKDRTAKLRHERPCLGLSRLSNNNFHLGFPLSLGLSVPLGLSGLTRTSGPSSGLGPTNSLKSINSFRFEMAAARQIRQY